MNCNRTRRVGFERWVALVYKNKAVKLKMPAKNKNPKVRECIEINLSVLSLTKTIREVYRHHPTEACQNSITHVLTDLSLRSQTIMQEAPNAVKSPTKMPSMYLLSVSLSAV